jgi:hypothetical protein
MTKLEKSASSGMTSTTELEKARLALSHGELAVAQADAETRYLLGMGGNLRLDPLQPPASTPLPQEEAPRPRPAVPSNIDAALARSVTVNFTEALIKDIAKVASDLADVSVVVDEKHLESWGMDGMKINLSLRGSVPLRNVLQALADQYDFAFMLRDYGILVTTPDRARELNAAVIPSDIPLNAR